MRGIFLFVLYRILMRNFLRIIVGVKYFNVESLSKNNQFIIVSNHNSHLDTMAIMSVLNLAQLEKEGLISKRKVKKAIKKYQINDVTAADAGNTEGSG